MQVLRLRLAHERRTSLRMTSKTATAQVPALLGAGSSDCAGDAEGGGVICRGFALRNVDGQAVVVVLPGEFAGVSQELDVFDFADAESGVLRERFDGELVVGPSHDEGVEG